LYQVVLFQFSPDSSVFPTGTSATKEQVFEVEICGLVQTEGAPDHESLPASAESEPPDEKISSKKAMNKNEISGTSARQLMPVRARPNFSAMGLNPIVLLT
jgi:hypothetical protein